MCVGGERERKAEKISYSCEIYTRVETEEGVCVGACIIYYQERPLSIVLELLITFRACRPGSQAFKTLPAPPAWVCAMFPHQNEILRTVVQTCCTDGEGFHSCRSKWAQQSSFNNVQKNVEKEKQHKSKTPQN